MLLLLTPTEHSIEESGRECTAIHPVLMAHNAFIMFPEQKKKYLC